MAACGSGSARSDGDGNHGIKTMALTIGDLGKATNTKVETVRYYERIGLLPKPPRSTGNYRSYGAAELGRLSFIRRARDLGFPLDQVRALLGLSDDRSCDCADIDRLAKDHLREVDRKIADLKALRRELKAVIDSCDGGTVGDCRIIEALGPRATD
jgi:Cu(I)-responsive transcriptional regulator